MNWELIKKLKLEMMNERRVNEMSSGMTVSELKAKIVVLENVKPRPDSCAIAFWEYLRYLKVKLETLKKEGR